MQPKKANNDVWQQIMKMTKKTTPEQIVQLLQKNKDCIHWVSPTGADLLCTASARSNYKVAEELLKLGIPVNRADKNGRTALHYAAAVGCISIFELLVEKGADINGRTIGGETPLLKGAFFSQKNIIEWYLNNSLESFYHKNNLNEGIAEYLHRLNRPLEN